MNLAIDIGNSFTHLAVFKESRMIYSQNFNSHSSAELGKALKLIPKKQDLRRIGISSVASDRTNHIDDIVRKKFKISPVIINNKSKLPINIKILNSTTLGADRICNAVCGYAEAKGKSNVLIIDLGTANTYDLVLKNGDFVGGIIAPGVMTSSRALNKNTGRLPLLDYTELSSNAPLIGRNTFDAIRSGLVNYMKFATEGIVAAVKKKYGHKLLIVLTGGSSGLLGSKLDFKYISKKNAVLEGINIILNSGKQRKT